MFFQFLRETGQWVILVKWVLLSPVMIAMVYYGVAIFNSTPDTNRCDYVNSIDCRPPRNGYNSFCSLLNCSICLSVDNEMLVCQQDQIEDDRLFIRVFILFLVVLIDAVLLYRFSVEYRKLITKYREFVTNQSELTMPETDDEEENKLDH